MRKAVFALFAGLLFCAQTMLPGFPPGLFGNRAYLSGSGGGSLSCSYTPVTAATYNVAYTGATPSASGGTPSYTFSNTGSLPPGFSINSSTGVISGTDTVDSSGATYPGIQVSVTDSLSNTANCGGSFTITVAGGSVIKSIHQYSITIAASSLTNTATITSVTTANTVIIWQGTTSTSSTSGAYNRAAVRLTLTNSTTVTATRENNSDSTTINFTVVEFASGVNSIQAGTITVASGSASNTATISAVGANAFVLYLGESTAGTNGYSDSVGAVQLTNSTTVTAFAVNTAVAKTVSYMVADLDTTVVDGVPRSFASTFAGSTTSDATTITSVDTTRSVVFPNGNVPAATQVADRCQYVLTLTNATTVTGVRAGGTGISRTYYGTVVQFAASAVNSLQSGTIALSSPTATITSVNTAKAVAVMTGFNSSTATTPNAVFPDLTLTNSTTVTATVTTGTTTNVGWSALEFK